MAEHLSVSEIEVEAKRLKRNLESWREIILSLHSILLWEKNWDLGIILGTTSSLFFLIWQMNLSFLSMVSLLGITISVVDYLVPKITTHLSHPEKWTSTDERKLEDISRSLAIQKIFITNMIKSLYQMKSERPKCYYAIVIITLLFLSWIGNSVNNLFLTYLVVTSVLLFPGLKRRGIIDKYTSCASNMIKDKLGYAENLKTK